MVNNDNNMINDDNSSSSSNKGKWSDRIKKIRIDRFKKVKNITFFENENLFLLKLGKVFLTLPSVIYTNIKYDEKKLLIKKDFNNNKKKLDSVNDINLDNVVESEDDKSYIDDKNILLCMKNRIVTSKIDEIRKINVHHLKENSIKTKLDEKNQNSILQLKKENLQKEIIYLIKKKLVRNINELEILQSELYVISKIDSGDIYLEQCRVELKEIKKLFSRIKILKEKYDFLKDNFNFQYMLQFDDNLLIDKILELKNMYNNLDVSKTINDYKILNEYKYLYLKIDKLEEETFKLEKHKEEKLLELKKRDIDFESFKIKIYDFDRINDQYNNFVKEQELYLMQLDEKISYIDKHEKIIYKLKGFNGLLSNSFKYIGLLLLNPFKGLIPGIVSQTLLTRNIVHNLYKNMEWEESKKIVYDTIDYSLSIDVVINNLEDIAKLADSTLDEIFALKNKYKKEFSKYESSFSGYKDAISKLNKIENAILNSKIKINITHERMKENEKINSSKLNKIKQLNQLK